MPDFSTPEWQARFAKAPVCRGRPKSDVTKVQTTFRLDPDVIAAFRSDGPGWQTRMNEALRKAAGLS
ncbi:MAG: BrnA antitoxin family protein [bacterium]|nr:BrnA antitoxin family protein [bacterium]